MVFPFAFGCGKLTLPERRIRQRWEATGAPNSGAGRAGWQAHPVCAFHAGKKAVNPRGMGTGPHVKRLLFLFNEWRLITELVERFSRANYVVHTSVSEVFVSFTRFSSDGLR